MKLKLSIAEKAGAAHGRTPYPPTNCIPRPPLTSRRRETLSHPSAHLLRPTWISLQGEGLIPCTRRVPRARPRTDAWSRADCSAIRSCLENRFEEQSSLASPRRTKRAWTSRRRVKTGSIFIDSSSRSSENVCLGG